VWHEGLQILDAEITHLGVQGPPQTQRRRWPPQGYRAGRGREVRDEKEGNRVWRARVVFDVKTEFFDLIQPVGRATVDLTLHSKLRYRLVVDAQREEVDVPRSMRGSGEALTMHPPRKATPGHGLDTPARQGQACGSCRLPSGEVGRLRAV
jgi:hypothetical protein